MSDLNQDPQQPSGPQNESEDALERSLRAGIGTCPSPALMLAFTEGVLPDEASSPIREHVAQCGVCQMLLADTAAFEEQPTLTPGQEARIAARIGSGNVSPNPSVSSRWRFAGLSIAATLIVSVLGTGVWLRARPAEKATVQSVPQPQSHDVKPIPAELAYVEPLAPPAPKSSDLLTRGEDGNSTNGPTVTELMPAFRAYNRKDYASAVTAFRADSERYPGAPLPALYLGVAELELNDNAAAAKTLTPLTQRNKPSQDALWYAAVAEARVGSPVAATLFESICAAGTSYAHTSESCRLAAELKR